MLYNFYAVQLKITEPKENKNNIFGKIYNFGKY